MYTFKAKDDHEYKRSGDIGKYIADGELKHKDNKNVLFDRSYIRHEMNTIQSKYQNIGTQRISEISLSCYDDKNTYVELDVIGYLIFTNLLPNQTKKNFSVYREIILIVALNRTAIFISTFSPN